MANRERPFAVFDVDGTIIRWQLFHAVVDTLAKSGKIDPEKFKNAKSARMVWKNRTAASSFKDYELALINVHEEALKSISYDDYMAAIQAVFEEYKDQTYTFTRDLIKELKTKDYLIFAVSGSQQEIVKLLADHLGFDDYAGSQLEVVNGKFTGKSSAIHAAQKPLVLAKLVKKHHATYEHSYAVGDTDRDSLMLAEVQHPIAFNPNRELFELAKSKGWPVVVERKNVIYRLEPENKTYRIWT